jgi:NTP pyrophosphatase (non-canonical NTP hydrolase)
MDFHEYQTKARKTAIYPRQFAVLYPVLGLVGEIGEFANKYKKEFRDDTPFELEDAKAELGDILWYLSQIASDLELDLNEVARHNIAKLMDRQNRGVLGGSGDLR